LSALNASQRNCRYRLSMNTNFFIRARLTMWELGPSRMPMPELPKRYGPGVAKAFLLNHKPLFGFATDGSPTRLGRVPQPLPRVAPGEPKVRGSPELYR